MKKFILVLFVCSLTSAASFAQRIAIVPKIGTMGAGADLAVKLTDSVHMRAGYSTGSYDQEQETSGVTYDSTLDVGGADLMLDLHPGGRSFHFTIGAFMNETEGEARSTEDTVIVINDQPYNVSEIGTLRGTASYEDVAPYVGIGWGNAFGGSRWSFYFDLGAAYVGEPELDLVAIRNDPSQPFPPGFEEDLEAEEEELREEMTDYEIFPVVQFGVGFRF